MICWDTGGSGIALGELRSGDLYDFKSMATLFFIGVVSITPTLPSLPLVKFIASAADTEDDDLEKEGGLSICIISVEMVGKQLQPLSACISLSHGENMTPSSAFTKTLSTPLSPAKDNALSSPKPTLVLMFSPSRRVALLVLCMNGTRMLLGYTGSRSVW
ncbi:hypothetical protein Pint_03461 [Pistacia integerrima]|uniref:Uncharacterized protein n=1 Tax=Pistacia integerrima TaxID=434235 RepID=A0ACC0ZIS3_9ROSI|nr:hypothetical protein Pint_03461 [Pistacia integerrima]